MKQVFKSPAFVVLMALGLLNAMVSLWFAGEIVRHADLSGDPGA